jgi:F-type H+-transporting ATPase subunit a
VYTIVEQGIDSLQHGHAALDTAQAAAHEGAAQGGAVFTELLHHLYDSHELDFEPLARIELPHFAPFHLAGISFDMSITKHVVFLWIAGALLCLLAIAVARANRRSLVPRGFGGLVEVFVVFVRDEIVVPNMGEQGIKYLPYLLTTFFYILLMNLIGLLPWGSSPTGNVNVTGGLAIVAFVMIQFAAIRAQGFGHYLKHLTGGVHWALWPIMIPIEILGLFTKAFALCIRLFANMIGGHMVLVSLIGLIFLFQSYLIALGPLGFTVAMNFLELFVALLQAYIFTMLTSLFMGLGMQPGEQHEQGAQSHGT